MHGHRAAPGSDSKLPVEAIKPFPFATGFTPVEQKLLPALSLLRQKTATRLGMVGAVFSAMAAGTGRADHEEELARMKLGAC